MRFSLRKKRHLALVGDSSTSILAEILKSAGGVPGVKILSRAEGSLKDKQTLSKLLENITDIKGELSIALPLHFFEISSIYLPSMPEGAIDKTLPYHLSKTLDKPLSDYIFDWQINFRVKDRMHLNVYLLPVSLFNHLRETFNNFQVSITYIEADIFSAFAFLDKHELFNKNETTLCALLWSHNITIGVLEKNLLTLTRTVVSKRPDTPYISINDTLIKENDTAGISKKVVYTDEGEKIIGDNEIEVKNEGVLSQNAIDDLLDSFNLFGDAAETQDKTGSSLNQENPLALEETETEIISNIDFTVQPVLSEEQQTRYAWDNYLQTISLEIMRTRDYYGTVQKGDAIKHIVVGGAGDCWNDLQETIMESLGADILQFPETNLASADVSTNLLNAICSGTGTRWYA